MRQHSVKNAIQENENTRQFMTDEAQLNKFSCSGKLNCKLSRYRTGNQKNSLKCLIKIAIEGPFYFYMYDPS